MTPGSEISVLLVEDNDFDVRRIERAFAKLNAEVPLHRAIDGQDAIEILSSGIMGQPIVILLDINMPRMNGIEFLKELRSDPMHRATPVHVITTSDYFKDIEAVYEHGISGYYVKPSTGSELIDVTRSLLHLAGICRYPDHGAPP